MYCSAHYSICYPNQTADTRGDVLLPFTNLRCFLASLSCLFVFLTFVFGRLSFLFKGSKYTLFTMLISAIATAEFVRFGGAILIVLLAVARVVCFPGLGVPSVVRFAQSTSTALCVLIIVSAACGTAWISSRGPAPALSVLRFMKNGFCVAIHAATVSSITLVL